MNLQVIRYAVDRAAEVLDQYLASLGRQGEEAHELVGIADGVRI
jgi:hypothetical protein